MAEAEIVFVSVPPSTTINIPLLPLVLSPGITLDENKFLVPSGMYMGTIRVQVASLTSEYCTVWFSNGTGMFSQALKVEETSNWFLVNALLWLPLAGYIQIGATGGSGESIVSGGGVTIARLF